MRQRITLSVTFIYEATGVCSGKVEMSPLGKVEMSPFGPIEANLKRINGVRVN